MSDIARRPAGQRILEPDRQERRQASEALRAAARVIFGDPVELPRIRDLSAFGKYLLAAAAVTVLASMVLLVSASAAAGQQSAWQVTAAEVVAPAGLLAGSILVLHATTCSDWLAWQPARLSRSCLPPSPG